MKDNEFSALMRGMVLKRQVGETGIMIKLDGRGGLIERTFNSASGKTIGTRTIDHVDVALLELNDWTILPAVTPF